MMRNYLQTVADVYAEAAIRPDATLCCTQSPVWHLPDLRIPPAMLAMNYGCGSTVSLRDLRGEDTILYVGVGGGLEALQFAYFTRQPGRVIAVDPVAAMRERARTNFVEAARLNAWFQPDFVTLLDGSALALPVPSGMVTVAAQNCLFNIFTVEDLTVALAEIARVMRPGGLFSTSDPITPVPLPADLANDPRLRARCLSGCQTFPAYIAALTSAGFGRVEVRSRIPYRYLHPRDYPALNAPVLLESIEVTAFKVPNAEDGPAVFTGRHAVYHGAETTFTDDAGFTFQRGIPIAISDAAALRLARHPDMVVTEPTYHYLGGGCC